MGFGVVTGETATTVVKGDGFYPDLPVATFLTLYRLPAEYAESLHANHLTLAQIWAAGLLLSWRAKQEAAGHTSIDTIEINGIEQGATILYNRAVFAHAKAILLQNFPSIERRESARNDAKETPETADQFFATAQKAISAIIGRTFVSVEAI